MSKYDEEGVFMGGASLGDCFSESFSARKEKPAITFLRDGRVESELSYLELERDIDRMAGLFQTLGVEKGDRIIFLIPKSMILVVAHLALQKIGALSVPLNPGFKKSELEYLLKDAQPKIILSEPGMEALIREIDPAAANLIIDTQKSYHEIEVLSKASEEVSPVEVNPDDPALIIYTSGTTGNPKGTILSQMNLIHDARNIINIWEISDSDTLCHALPLFHVHGLCFALHTALLAGAHVVMLDRFSPRRIIETLGQKTGRLACTVFMAVPAMYGKMMEYLGDERPDFGHMRLWTSGSAPLLAADFERIKQIFGKQPVEREGMSETGMNFSNPLHGQRKPGSIGLPLPGLEVRTVDPASGRDVAPGQTGEFWLKGPAITQGYWRKPDETKKTFEQGWFKTGDLGNIDKDGYYYLTDRIKHIIISGGENISPKEVEAVINRIDGVVESSVVGVFDEKWGEKIVAAVVKKPDADVGPDDIRAMCKKHLHDWKCPKKVNLVKELPRNTMGKVLKEEVKKLF
jgi:malonyl-CoA/methylmalonyl-CoA synthetase